MKKNWNLWISCITAKDLAPVKFSDKTEVYAVASIYSGGQKTKQMTVVHRDEGINPTWNDPMNFAVEAEFGLAQSLVLELLSDKGIYIGEVWAPVKDLMGSIGCSPTYWVLTLSGNLEGRLNFMYAWADKVTGAVSPPARAYNPSVMRPPWPYGAAGAETGQYPPYRLAYAGETPPAPPFGPPPPVYWYPSQPGWYPPVQQPPANNNTFWTHAALLGRLFAGAEITHMLNNGLPDDIGFLSPL